MLPFCLTNNLPDSCCTVSTDLCPLSPLSEPSAQELLHCNLKNNEGCFPTDFYPTSLPLTMKAVVLLLLFYKTLDQNSSSVEICFNGSTGAKVLG